MQQPDARSQIEYAKKRLRRKYRGPSLTSGPLTAGNIYQILSLADRDNFLNVGALNQAGETFKATGTTPTAWHGSVLALIKLQDLKADADKVFQAATDTVTITSGSFEGGAGGGQITFRKDVLGMAYEELIEEFDPEWVPAMKLGEGIVMQFGV